MIEKFYTSIPTKNKNFSKTEVSREDIAIFNQIKTKRQRSATSLNARGSYFRSCQ